MRFISYALIIGSGGADVLEGTRAGLVWGPRRRRLPAVARRFIRFYCFASIYVRLSFSIIPSGSILKTNIGSFVGGWKRNSKRTDNERTKTPIQSYRDVYTFGSVSRGNPKFK